jgi:hypothetical protein
MSVVSPITSMVAPTCPAMAVAASMMPWRRTATSALMRPVVPES